MRRTITLVADGWNPSGQVAWRLGLTLPQYEALLEDPGRRMTWEVWDRIAKLYGWPQMFA